MSDNILQFPQLGPVSDFSGYDDRKRRTIAWLREFCDRFEADSTGIRAAVAVFVEDPSGAGYVQAGGFTSDSTAARELTALTKQLGVAQ